MNKIPLFILGIFLFLPTTGVGSTGPYHALYNPKGNGPTVSNYVSFTPWITPVSGSITTNTTWTASSTYVVDGPVTISSGITLTIKEGVVVKFKTETSGLNINGTLHADATASSSKIYFTSYKDDVVGGDTNLDGSATSPSAGDWDTITVNSGATTTLINTVVRYGGNNTVGSSKMTWNNGGALEIYNSEVATSSSYGVYSTGATIIIAIDIHGHDYGVYRASGFMSVGSSNIHDNSSYGVYNALGGNNIHAENNYWGASSGPFHPILNLLGGGDRVSSDVDFNPYLYQVRYLFVGNDGTIVSAVHNNGGNKVNYVATSTNYMPEWYNAVSTWNARGKVAIATSTSVTTTDLWVFDLNEGSSAGIASYSPNHFSDGTQNDTLKFNVYYMASSTTSVRKLAALHELGHALGLFHSYIGNIMLSYSTSTGQTTLGAQDISDYDYLWP